jgi:hypothetical protein
MLVISKIIFESYSKVRIKHNNKKITANCQKNLTGIVKDRQYPVLIIQQQTDVRQQ